jgi:hypothetical protein
MRPIRKILVPTDFSPEAREAFRNAVVLAKATGAGVVVYHVTPPSRGHRGRRCQRIRPTTRRLTFGPSSASSSRGTRRWLSSTR